MKSLQEFGQINLHLASPEKIREWSYGEVKKPETINYRTLRPERDGLFCERIFGTTKEWECYCGKFKSVRYKGVVCDRCGVEVTHFRVRRERMGHIELAAPVAHIWFYRAVPSRIGLLLDMSVADLRSVLYYECYIVTNPGDTDLEKGEVLLEEEYLEMREKYGMSFAAGMGASAIRDLLEDLDLEKLIDELRYQMEAKGLKTDKRLLKRVEIAEDFRDSGNKTSWMIITVLPVIPPDVRPMVQLDGGRFATSDLNDLYRRVVNRNNRLKRLMALNAPDIIIRNEKRMLQEAVDALFDNGKKQRVVKNAVNRPLRSLSDLLRGKQGRFRQNLLGKRVDYSGRSVIVVGPELKLHQCGIPVKMALELFKPFIIQRLMEEEVVFNIKKAKMLVEQEAPEVFAVLDEIVENHPVMLNRAPTLHSLGIQVFMPVLVPGKAIRLHPLVCHAYNADFDGDQMALHLPLTLAAQIECIMLMLSSRNLLNPANGQPIVVPSLDIVLGINYLTSMREGCKGEDKRFLSEIDVLFALENDIVEHHTRIEYYSDGQKIVTTPGRVYFNSCIPDGIDFINEELTEESLTELIAYSYKHHGCDLTVRLLDEIKTLGFRFATYFGCTIGLDDIAVPSSKDEVIQAANDEVQQVLRQYKNGLITAEERYNRVVEVWSRTSEKIGTQLMDVLKEDKNGFNQVYKMISSGARGSKNQLRQLGGMRGLMAKSSGEIIELPIRSNFKEGLSVIEFFISTNGARKGLADTSLKTSDAGYLTRRLVDIAQDVVISMDDCGTINGIEMSALKEDEGIVERLADRIRGRFTLERVWHPITSELIVDVNQEITDELAERIEELGIESVFIRTVLTCEAEKGVCRLCYGRTLATNKTVEKGEAVGIIAAQSIGQPGTQLTMRTFHIGGAAMKAAEEDKINLDYDAYVQKVEGNTVAHDNGARLFTRKGSLTVSRVFASFTLEEKDEVLVSDKQKVILDQPIIVRKGKKITTTENAYTIVTEKELYLVAQPQEVEMHNGSELHVKVGDFVPAGNVIALFDPYSDPIICEYSGVVKYIDVYVGTTLHEGVNPDTGLVERTITDQSVENLQPRIAIEDDEGNVLATYSMPNGAFLNVEENTRVEEGVILAKMLRESVKTRDITGGLPRVGELFEARHPRIVAILAQITGVVSIGGVVKGSRTVVVTDKFGKQYKHLIPMGRHMFVREGDMVKAGEALCDGSVDAHDVLSVLGENALQRFLVNEIQEIYRLQGVKINDKHIGVIIRQMMRKVEIVQTGDTSFIIGQRVYRTQFRDVNNQVVRQGGQPAVARPTLQGITRASLNIESFISAASFQETTRVLTNAAIRGASDPLHGLKENVIIGNLIPAGTGVEQYRNAILSDRNGENLNSQIAKLTDEHTKMTEEMEKKAQMNRSVETERINSLKYSISIDQD